MDGHHAPQRSTWIRDSEASDLLEHFLVSGVATILIVRFYLALTGYPQIGGHGLHIAHLLWGGLLMLIAIVALLTFLGRRVKHTAAIVGGVGFGLFIDELGKFITSDNNYFFRPTIAIIYAIFILLFLVFREVAQSRTVSTTWYLANAIALIESAVIQGWTPREQLRAAAYLQQSDAADPMVAALGSAAAHLRLVRHRVSRLTRLLDWLRATYFRLVGAPWFRSALIAIFVLQVISAILDLLEQDLGLIIGRHVHSDLTFSEWAVGASSVLAATLAVIGLLSLPRSRLTAYHWFRRAVLISIFFGRFFAFLNVDLATLAGLIFDLLILIALQFVIHQEQSEAERVAIASDAVDPPLSVEGIGRTG